MRAMEKLLHGGANMTPFYELANIICLIIAKFLW